MVPDNPDEVVSIGPVIFMCKSKCVHQMVQDYSSMPAMLMQRDDSPVCFHISERRPTPAVKRCIKKYVSFSFQVANWLVG